VRETVLRGLKLLPINTGFQNHVDMLKESRLGRHVMLLMKLPDETLANKKAAKELVEAWSRPIFADSQVRLRAGLCGGCG
jgi:transcription factor SPN1